MTEVKRGRTRPAEDSPEEDKVRRIASYPYIALAIRRLTVLAQPHTGFSQSAPGHYRSRVDDYANRAAVSAAIVASIAELMQIYSGLASPFTRSTRLYTSLYRASNSPQALTESSRATMRMRHTWCSS